MKIATESDLAAATWFPLSSPGRALVFAPHADDEVFACGGTLRRLIEADVQVTVVVISDGALGGGVEATDPLERVLKREAESIAAAALLGYPAPQFWRLADRGLRYGETLITRLQQLIETCDAELVFAPAPSEMHPDHQVVAFAAAEALRRTSAERCLASYEVGVPLTANVLIDISAQLATKQDAIRCFDSQLAEQPYDDRMLSLNRYRAYSLGAQVEAAEAFHCQMSNELRSHPSRLSIAQQQWRRRLEVAGGPADLPLVSVIIRSMDRPTLNEALDSVALQTWPNIEIVLVNARGADHRPLPTEWCGLPLVFVSATDNVERAVAANRGLDAARGEYLMFLDDDDWLDADHIQKLVHALKRQPQFGAAYSDVRCVDENGASLARTFAEPYHAARLLAGNFIPIHAVLFARNLLALGCRVDESLPVYEDWDFWLQLARHGEFLHVEGTSAVYRITPQGGFGVTANQQQHETLRQKIYCKWLGSLSSQQIGRLIQTIHQDGLKDERIAALQDHSEQQNTSIAALESHIRQQEMLNQQLEDAVSLRDRHLAYRDGEVAGLKTALADREQRIGALLESTSWRVTKPFRWVSLQIADQCRKAVAVLRPLLRRHGRRLYHRLPESWRTPLLEWSFRHLGGMFRGMPRYEQWRGGAANHNSIAVAGQYLLALDNIEPATTVHGRIAIHLHLYYHDLAKEFAQLLKHMPFGYDLYVSVTSDDGLQVCQQMFSGLPHMNQLIVERVPNRGRDIAPFFCAFGDRLCRYDYVAHLHGKKSLYNSGATTGWREYLCTALLGSEMQLRRIFTLLQGTRDTACGIVYPQNFHLLPYQANTWLANQALGVAWCARLGIQSMPRGYFHLPAGTMFWARTDALQPLFQAGITLDDFDEEQGQTDGTLAHCLERLLTPASLHSGFSPGILRDPEHPRWSAWNLDQYLGRDEPSFLAALDDPDIELIAFDIFDTLLCRPLLDAESIKTIVSQRLGGEYGQRYRALRSLAEAQARKSSGRDVGLNEIYQQFGKLTGWSTEQLTRIRIVEEETEVASVAVRPAALALYRHALASRRPVALISDMFLPRVVIEHMLQQHGISDWDRLFLSNEIGVRKDGGLLYEHVLTHYSLQPGQMLMIGDNERSDWQIPLDRGIRCLHLLRPVELARALPRLQALVSVPEPASIDDELTLGLVVRKNFSFICHPKLDPASLFDPDPENIGYSLVGPLLVAMSHWLLDAAIRDRIDRLYFLAREGQLMQQVFDIWTEGLNDLPQSRYLVLSRRAVSVPAIRTLDDILAIARATYFPNTLANFIFERYGLELTEERWTQLRRQVNLGSDSQIEVRDQNSGYLGPFLSAIQNDILQQAQDEQHALQRYLADMSLGQPGRQAVVDVGYGGTIQDYLNRLTTTPVHGYYLMTNLTAHDVARRHGVLVRGGYHENIDPEQTPPILFRHSFELEKLLSSSDAQVVRYVLDSQQRPAAQHRTLTTEETASASFRTQLQQGVLQYAREARDVRHQLCPAFAPSLDVAQKLFAAFFGQLSATELAALQAICLDDHYCGRGLVR